MFKILKLLVPISTRDNMCVPLISSASAVIIVFRFQRVTCFTSRYALDNLQTEPWTRHVTFKKRMSK